MRGLEREGEGQSVSGEKNKECGREATYLYGTHRDSMHCIGI